MDIAIVRLLLDFGLLILIWIVQLVIYPSFSYFEKDNLIKWHHVYTLRIGVLVMPMMIGQITISLIQIFTTYTFYNLIDLTLIVGVWLSTFLHFVPMHMNISKGIIDDKLKYKLVFYNWIRVFLWATIFLLNLYVCLQ